MKITEIGAENFRTLELLTLRLSQNYCAISGRNNAGKSGIVSIIEFFLGNTEEYRYSPFPNEITFSKDATKWSDAESLKVFIEVIIDKNKDSEIFFVVVKLSGLEMSDGLATVKIEQTFGKDDSSKLTCYVDGKALDQQVSSEILKKVSPLTV